VDRDLSVVNRGVGEKIPWGYEEYYKVDEGDEGRYKSMGCMREMRIMGI
jgi:hypothetical protein